MGKEHGYKDEQKWREVDFIAIWGKLSGAYVLCSKSGERFWHGVCGRVYAQYQWVYHVAAKVAGGRKCFLSTGRDGASGEASGVELQ